MMKQNKMHSTTPVGISILIMLFFSYQTSGQISFQKNYGAASTGDYGFSVIQSADNGYFIAGVRVSQSGSSFIGEGLLKRTDKYGNELWTNYYFAPDSIDLNFDHMEKASDGNLIITGVADYGFSNDHYDVYLTKIDTAGNVLWYKNYGGLHRQRGMQVKETFDNGFIIGGWNEIDGSANSISFYLIKTNNTGDTLWTRTYPNNGMRQTGYTVEQTPDSGYVIAGSIQLPLQFWGPDIYIMKTNAVGDTLWTKIIDYPGTGEARDVKISDDGNIVVSGWYSPTGCADPVLMELDQNGNIIWFEDYDTGFCEWNYSLCKTADNGYALFGLDSSQDFYLVKTDSIGNEQWFKKFDEGQDWGYNVRQTSDGGFIMTGTAATNGDINIVLIKTDGSGNILTSINEIYSPDSILIFPNPANNYINIELRQEINNTGLKVFNSMGQLLLSENIENKTSVTIDISKYSNGIYFIKMGNKLIKIIKD